MDDQTEAPLLNCEIPTKHAQDPEETSVGETSELQTFFNLYNQLEGLGLLAIPYVLRIGGWGALIVGVVVVFWSWFAGILLTRSLYDGSGKRVRTSYVEIASDCFGTRGRVAVAAFQFSNLIGEILDAFALFRPPCI
jgi:amino acid permease